MTPGMPKQGPPRPMRGGGAPPQQEKMPPPGMAPEPEAEGSGKVTREECLFVTADKHCGNCTHYQDDQSCDKVEGQMEPEDACLRYFEAVGEGEEKEPEPDADDTTQEPPYGDEAEDVR